jgi:hypothetical protein
MISRVAAQTLTIDAEARASVKDQTYDVWVSASFDSPPFPPFHDCFRFTNRRLCIDACGDCGSLSEVPLLGIWQARVSCGGLNLVFVGTSMDGPDTPVIGGTAVGREQKTNFAIAGVANASCSPDAAVSRGTPPYSKTQ